MKKLSLIALSVIVVTFAMAQENTGTATLMSNSQHETNTSEKGIVASQTHSAKAEGTVDANGLKDVAMEHKEAVKEQVGEIKDQLENNLSTIGNNEEGEIAVDNTLESGVHGAEVSNVAKSAVEVGTKGGLVSPVASITGQLKSAANLSPSAAANVKTGLKVAPKAIQTDVKVKTGVDVKPVKVNTKVKAITGIKL